MPGEMPIEELVACHELVMMQEGQRGGGSALSLEQERKLLDEIDRFRNCEAELEQQIWARKGDAGFFLRQAEELTARISAARAVHQPFEYQSELFCSACSDGHGDGSRGYIPWPCETDLALEPRPSDKKLRCAPRQLSHRSSPHTRGSTRLRRPTRL